MRELLTVVLAAGEGTRMKSSLPKVLHPVCGRPMILHVLEAAGRGAKGAPRVAVVGRGQQAVSELLAGRGWSWVVQEERLGTGHALLCARGFLEKHRGDVLVLNGDTPLVTRRTVGALVRKHRASKRPLTLLTARLDDPRGYGRIRRDGGEIRAVVEQRSLGRREDGPAEINGGVYVFGADFLMEHLPRLEPDKRSGEYYLTDLAAAAAAEGRPAASLLLERPEEVLGVNSRRQLAQVEAAMRRRLLDALMDSGVTVIDPAATYVGSGVAVGRDTVLYPGTILETGTRVGRECRIGPWSRVSESRLGDGVTVRDGSVVEGSVVRAGAVIGPMARLRPGTVVGAGARVGNFVEVKKSRLGDGVKASHLTYLGDALVGRGTNVGAGTVTCNYDGRRKHRTVIGEDAFIGSDVMLVAPVKVGRGAVIGAGSTITRDVPAGSLAVGRARQVNLEGRARRGGKS